MYVCMYVRMYLCMYLCVCVCVCVCVCTNICMYIIYGERRGRTLEPILYWPSMANQERIASEYSPVFAPCVCPRLRYHLLTLCPAGY